MTLTDSLLGILRQESRCLVEVLRGLAEVEKTRHYLEEGYPTMLAYCTERLGLSRSSALKRINAARLSVRFPGILPLLEAREIHLSALVMLSPHLTEENQDELLSLARGKSERSLERTLAGRFPQESKPKDFVRWLDEQTALLGIVLPADVLAMLERVAELRKHVHPDESFGDNLRDVLSDFLDRNDPLRKATPRERKPKLAYVHRRQIRRRIQVEVWKRDGGQCTFTSASGHRCGEQAGLQIDHRQAWADGGSSRDVSNLRLLCGPHNRYLAEKRFGFRKE